jgi:uncharacterized protein
MIEPGTRHRPAITLVMALLVATACRGTPADQPEATLRIETGGGPVEVRVEVADSSEERSRGLMGRRVLSADAGMVFLHDEPTSSGFWMKDTLIPLSVAFWDDRGRVLTIQDMEPCRAEPCQVYVADDLWTGAVEVNQGFFADRGVRVGDRVRLVD